MNICAPGKYDKQNNTCFTLEQLIEMAAAYNRYSAKHKLGTKQTNINKTAFIQIKPDKKYLLQELKQIFQQVCGNSEICLTKQAFMNSIVKEMREEFEDFTFRPEGPAGPEEWLSTFDINKYIMQYQQIYPTFIFLGAVPLDCDEHSFCTLFKIDFEKFHNNGIEYLAVIFNLDKYGQGGSHWVSLFIDLKNGEINFCDSNGKPPRKNIQSFINRFLQYWEKTSGKKAEYKYNKISYQTDNSECGVYSGNFIIRRLSGENFESVVNNYLSFRDINSCRNVYFRNATIEHKPNTKCDPKIN